MCIYICTMGRIVGWCPPPNSPTYSSDCQAHYNIAVCLSVFFRCIPMTLDNYQVSLSLQMCRLCLVFLLSSSYLVTTASTTYPPYSFIHLQKPIQLRLHYCNTPSLGQSGGKSYRQPCIGRSRSDPYEFRARPNHTNY